MGEGVGWDPTMDQNPCSRSCASLRTLLDFYQHTQEHILPTLSRSAARPPADQSQTMMTLRAGPAKSGTSHFAQNRNFSLGAERKGACLTFSRLWDSIAGAVPRRQYRLMKQTVALFEKSEGRGYVAQTMPEEASIEFDPLDLVSTHILVEVLYRDHIVLMFLEDLKTCAVSEE